MIELPAIERWLKRDGYECETLDGGPQAAWAVSTMWPRSRGRHIQVACIGKEQDLLEFQSRTTVVDEHRTKLLKLSPEDYQGFRFELLRDLLLSGAQYQLQEDPKERLTGYFVAVQTREEGLTRDTFFRALQQLHNASLLGVIHIRRAIGETI